MPVLHRGDKTVFQLQPYRELLSVKSAGLLKRELHLLAQNYGTYSRIFKKSDGRFEAVFASDPGYLLGETVWNYFEKPENLLYCEALPEKDKVLIVIVRNGYVHFDAKISFAQLADELATLQAGKESFTVYVHGNVPYVQGAQGLLDAAHTQSLTDLTESVFEVLPTLSEFNLLPIEQAIAELKLHQRAQRVTAAIAAVLVLSMGWYWYTSLPVTVAQAPTDPYQQYVQALTTPAPGALLNAVAQQMNVVYAVPGWVPTQVSYNTNGVQFQMHSLGGSLSTLLRWGKQKNINVVLSADGAMVSLPIRLGVRTSVPPLENNQENIAVIVDRMMQIIPNKSVQIGSMTPHEIYKETGFTIALTAVSPDVLSLIGRGLSGLPVTLSGGTFTLANGLLSGTLQLTLLGN